MPYLTGATIPTGFRCKVVRIPDDLAFLDALNGQLYELTLAENWETDGAITAQQMADAWSLIYDLYTTEQCIVIPIGEIAMFGSVTPPSKWLACNGAAVSRATYADLFAVIGETWGAGNGTTTFNLPDFRYRSPMGTSTSPSLVIGDAAGEAAHSLSQSELAAHTHAITDPGHVHGITDPGHVHSITDPGHLHGVNTAASGAAGSNNVIVANVANVNTAPTVKNSNNNTTGVTIQNHTTGVSVGSGTTGIIATDNIGGGSAHNTIHPVRGVPFIIYAGV